MGKIKLCRQLSETECGLCCVSMIASYFGYNRPLNFYRNSINVGRDGLSLQSMIQILNHINITAEIILVQSLSEFTFPFIAFDPTKSHFVVISGQKKDKFIVYDPTIGKTTCKIDEFYKTYSLILVCQPNENFKIVVEKEKVWKNFHFLFQENKKKLLTLFVLSAIVYVVAVSITFFIQQVVDDIQSNPFNYRNNYALLSLPLVIMASFFLISYIRNLILVKVEILLDRSLMLSMMNKILMLSFPFFDTRGSGEILFRFNLLQTIRQLMSNGLINILLDGGMLVCILIYSFILNPIFSVCVLIAVCLIACYVLIINQKILSLNQELMTTQSKVLNLQIELLSSIMLIKATAIEKFINNKFMKTFNKSLKKYKTTEKLMLLNSLILDTINLLFPFTLLICSLVFSFADTNSLGEKISLYILCGMAINKSTALFQNFTNISIIKSILMRLNDIYNSPEEEMNLTGAQVHSIECIEFKNVMFSYSNTGTPALTNISFRIEGGERVAFVGPSGSGKTTLVKLLTRLYEQTGGEIYINETKINHLNLEQFRSQITLVPQDFQLFDDSLLNNITLGLNYPEEDILKAIEQARLSEEVNQLPLGLNTKIYNMAHNFSGGQKQRVLLARALLKESSLIILDEATSSLDYINENEIYNNLKALNKTQIIIAHRLSSITNVDKIFYMEKGQILECGTHEQLINLKGRYYNLYTSQQNQEVFEYQN